MSVISQAYHRYIGMMGPNHFEKLRFWHEEKKLGADLIAEAIRVTSEKAEKPGIRYIEGILRNWYNDGIRTLADLEAVHSRDGPDEDEDGYEGMSEGLRNALRSARKQLAKAGVITDASL